MDLINTFKSINYNGFIYSFFYSLLNIISLYFYFSGNTVNK